MMSKSLRYEFLNGFVVNMFDRSFMCAYALRRNLVYSCVKCVFRIFVRVIYAFRVFSAPFCLCVSVTICIYVNCVSEF